MNAQMAHILDGVLISLRQIIVKHAAENIVELPDLSEKAKINCIQDIEHCANALCCMLKEQMTEFTHGVQEEIAKNASET